MTRADRQVLTGARIFDGDRMWPEGHALELEGDRCFRVGPEADAEGDRIDLDGGVLAPGFVDLQVNGGGGLMLNGAPEAATVARMAEAHARLGATSILPTLITDTPEITRAAIAAVEAAVREEVPGVAGLHLEGPHLDRVRAGAHDPALIRPMEAADLDLLRAAAGTLPSLIVTLSPGAASAEQIRALRHAGAIVSLGHSETTYDDACAALDAGAGMVTHLYNAMSPLTHRAPGLVGAALDRPVWAGIIADEVHVHPAALRVAQAAKPDRLFLVSDAMAVAGTEAQSFELNGRTILRSEGRLTLADGTLAGADLDLPRAVRVMHAAGASLETALSMATARPADAIERVDLGRIGKGRRADLCLLDDALHLAGVWQAGVRLI
ncbi:N-acetylglucosamine-6-phosphate deacetylase NagA [Roseivivax marinus]|uniref:N-acetylglucosamine-6-phosphate deacetylase NagA n=1 Tax=Roseivivax marinus TaxID=1379903 RepID=W4HLV8_9RHOB|nr:N-acetylglucosamine-6-phosphate deacetylase [Roseivivax marinus]ETW13734.1 N-acetylglucosamine-6-phosphate deacetylase NagA [Roseivivax marinus]